MSVGKIYAVTGSNVENVVTHTYTHRASGGDKESKRNLKCHNEISRRNVAEDNFLAASERSGVYGTRTDSNACAGTDKSYNLHKLCIST